MSSSALGRKRQLLPSLALAAAACLALSWCRSAAFVPQPQAASAAKLEQATGRRQVLAALGVPAAVAGAALTGAEGVLADGKVKSKWEGAYRDPLHPKCERKIVTAFDGKSGKLIGYDSEKGAACEQRDRQNKWTLSVNLADPNADEIEIEELTYTVTTREKKKREQLENKKPVVAKWDGTGIEFPDGTKWTNARYISKKNDMSMSDAPKLGDPSRQAANAFR